MDQEARKLTADVRPQPHPERYLSEVNYLNPADPIDAYLIDYRTAIDKDTVPTMAQQRVMIAGLRNGQSDALRGFIVDHMGIVAAVAYPYKGGGLTSEELLQAGIQALVRAGRDYARADSIDFSDFAAARINDELASLLPDKAGESYVGLSGYPMQDIYQFMQNLEVQEIPTEETLPPEETVPAEGVVPPEEAMAAAEEPAVEEPPAAEEVAEGPAIHEGPTSSASVTDAAETGAVGLNEAGETGAEPIETTPMVPVEAPEHPKRKLTLEGQFAEKCGFVEGAEMGEYDRETVFSHMKPKERRANEIYFFSGRKMNWKQVGDILGISHKAAYSRGARGWSQARNGIRKARRARGESL